MGKSAKVHKRVKRLTSKTSSAVTTPNTSSTQVQAAKKKASLKEKTDKNKGPRTKSTGVLGEADYVTLMMGGRRKADKEAKKLPQDDS